MKRLEESELIYGRMMRVDEPHLVERYNQALTGFGLKPVAPESFCIDMVGYSPEVANLLDDKSYLDPNGVNRRFIILSPQQLSLPVVNSAFSNTGRLMHDFFDANARVINALTVKDVVYGEIDDPIAQARDIEDLLAIEQVEFKVFTGVDLSGQAVELRSLVDRLMKEPNAWRDDAMLHRMVDLSKRTGDIRANALVPEEVVFRHNTFWSSHFGGVYVFLDDDGTTVIGDPEAPGFRRSRPWQVAYIDANDGERIYEFLIESGRVELPRSGWLARSGYVEHRIAMLLVRLAFHANDDAEPDAYDTRWQRNFIAKNQKLVDREGTYKFLRWAQRAVAEFEDFDLREIDTRGRFLLSRGKPDHPDAWLVNRLISDRLPFDFLSRYVFNKPAFYKDYETFGDDQREYVVDVIAKTYLRNKRGLRERLYGFPD
ncbi:MAG: DUF6638 family protein [Pseudomonadota bacterium]